MIEYWRSTVRDTVTICIAGTESIEAFKQLVQRGANLWPDAPASIKGFADLVTTGTIMQDYKSQEHSHETTSSANDKV
jgi:hypothetical protein